MRTVNRDEAIWQMQYQLGQLSKSMINGLGSNQPEVRRRTCAIVAEVLVDKGMRSWELLSDTPPPPTDMPGYSVNGAAD